MRTFEIRTAQLKSIEEIKHFLEEKKIRKGDTLKLLAEESSETFNIVLVLIVVFAAIMSVAYKGRKIREEEGERILEDIFKFKGKTPDDIEKKIEKKSGIKVKVERKKKMMRKENSG